MIKIIFCLLLLILTACSDSNWVKVNDLDDNYFAENYITDSINVGTGQRVKFKMFNNPNEFNSSMELIIIANDVLAYRNSFTDTGTFVLNNYLEQDKTFFELIVVDKDKCMILTDRESPNYVDNQCLNDENYVDFIFCPNNERLFTYTILDYSPSKNRLFRNDN